MATIQFSEKDVKAIQDGKKTVTRLVVTPQPILNGCFWELGHAGWSDNINSFHPVKGHSLWNRMPYHPGNLICLAGTGIVIRVKDVRMERLQEITEEQAIAEGYEGLECDCANSYIAGGMRCCDDCQNTGWREPPQLDFMYDWDENIQPEDLDVYGWYANPWVWVIEFELMKGAENT